MYSSYAREGLRDGHAVPLQRWTWTSGQPAPRGAWRA